MEAPITEKITDLSKVDSLLAELYRRAAGEGATAPTVRAALFNLVAYAVTEIDASEAAQSVGEIVGSHPCRAIIIDAMPPQPEEAEASVSVICGITPRGERRLCGEVIRLHIHRDGSAVIGTIMPLLIPDVPVALWIPGEVPSENEAFCELINVSTSIIIDSRRFSNIKCGMEFTVRYGIGSNWQKIIEDLAWINLEPWRELTAEHFDPPVLRHYLDELSEIDIKYSIPDDHSFPPSTPLLLASWLIDRLGLTLIGARRVDGLPFEIETTQHGELVMLRLIPEQAQVAPGQLSALTIRAGREANLGTFITQGASETEISITEECRGICFPPKTIQLPSQRKVALAGQALDLYRRDRTYESVLELALQILGLIEGGERPEEPNPVLS